MFSAPSLTVKSIMVTLLYWAVKQAVGFILFQVKPFRFGWCSIDIPPIDFAFLAHFGFLSAFGQHDRLEIWTIIKEPMTSKGTAYMFIFAKACPCQPSLLLCKIHYSDMQPNSPKQVWARPIVCLIYRGYFNLGTTWECIEKWSEICFQMTNLGTICSVHIEELGTKRFLH